MIRAWWKARQRRRYCFHHDRHTGESWISDQIIDWRKLFWCRHCERSWVI